MRLIYALTILILFISNLHGQQIHIGPAEGNSVLRHHLNQEAVQQAYELEKRFGISPTATLAEGPFNNCPPKFSGILLDAGEEIFFDLAVDTLVLGGGGGMQDVIALQNCGSFTGGTVNLDTTALTYTSFSNLTGVETDTICIEFCRENNGGCDDIIFVITVKRPGRSIVASPMTVDRESINMYCLDDELDFPGDRACSQFIECDDNYGGEGQQLFSFSNYNYADTCLIYYSNRFPGVDTVCTVICDENVICDTFKIPFIITGDTLAFDDLPFFDDFTYDGPYPRKELWLDRQAFVNKTFADSLPSVGMATLDGVNHKGAAYTTFQGVGDKLTSVPMDLTDFDFNENLVLKFYFAPKGFGKAPTLKDSLLVEFKNENGSWETIDYYLGIDPEPGVLDTTPAFEFRSYILDNKFIYDAFQFRFKAYTSPGGMVDLWHVDYVWFGTTSDPGDFFGDVAFTDPPPSILKTYSSMPWWHFEGFEEQELALRDTANVRYFNHQNFTGNIDDGSNFLREITTQTEIYNDATALAFNVIPGISNIQYPIEPSAIDDEKNALKNDFAGAEMLNFESTYWLTIAQDSIFRFNDTIVSNTIFDNYFAYDDGSAERQLSINAPTGGEKFAVKYRTNIEDTLRAVQMLFPHLNGDVSSQFFNLSIYTEPLANDPEPIHEQTFQRAFYPHAKFDTIQGFTTYRLMTKQGVDTALVIPAGELYLGFTQVTSGVEFGIPIGLDVNNTCDGCILFRINELMPWTVLPEQYQNAPMMRPVFRYRVPETTSSGVNEIKTMTEVMEIYPNPASDLLFVRLKEGEYSDYKAMIFNNVGLLIEDLPFEDQISLERYQSGIYYIQIQNQKTKERFVQKIVIVK